MAHAEGDSQNVGTAHCVAVAMRSERFHRRVALIQEPEEGSE